MSLFKIIWASIILFLVYDIGFITWLSNIEVQWWLLKGITYGILLFNAHRFFSYYTVQCKLRGVISSKRIITNNIFFTHRYIHVILVAFFFWFIYTGYFINMALEVNIYSLLIWSYENKLSTLSVSNSFYLINIAFYNPIAFYFINFLGFWLILFNTKSIFIDVTWFYNLIFAWLNKVVGRHAFIINTYLWNLLPTGLEWLFSKTTFLISLLINWLFAAVLQHGLQVYSIVGFYLNILEQIQFFALSYVNFLWVATINTFIILCKISYIGWHLITEHVFWHFVLQYCSVGKIWFWAEYCYLLLGLLCIAILVLKILLVDDYFRKEGLKKQVYKIRRSRLLQQKYKKLKLIYN